MKLNNLKNNVIKGEVLKTEMTMRVRLEDGRIIYVAGNARRGSILDLLAVNVSREGNLLGYEGYRIAERSDIARRPKLAEASDRATLFDGPIEVIEVKV